MADVGEEDEYESDPEQAKLSLKMRRRREASDDEEDDDDVRVRVRDSRVSDYESDCQGAAAEYDDDEEYDLVEEEEELIEEVEVEGVREDVDRVIEGDLVKRKNDSKEGDGFYVRENVDEFDENGNGKVEEGGQEEKKEKENEPFAVPTAGAFYMHDDRFRDSAGGRHRRTLGGRKLWELRDDRKWGHDKFEEMTMQERHYDEGRRVSRGRNRARGRNRGDDRGYVRENRPKAYNNDDQNSAPRSLRGRGPRRYQPSTHNKFEVPAQHRQPTKLVEKTFHATTSTSESAQVPSRKNIIASNLNSASPPFYPSGSSNKEINSTQKRDTQTGPINRGANYPISQSNLRGRNASDSLGMDKLYIDDSASSLAGKHLNNLGQMSYQPVNKVSLPNQVRSFHRAPVPSQVQPNLKPSGPQLGARPASGSRAPTPPKASSAVHSDESAELESLPESIDSKTALVGIGKGKGSIQSSGMSSFSYAGAQVMGGNHGDQNFPGGPTFLPVLQFAGQHPGGLGVPAVGMAFPGYVSQPNGMGNSEMTWLPVLAGAAGALDAAGALGATYCSPYITMDGAYHARPSGQTSSLPPASSKDGNISKPGNEVKPSQRPELANDELRQRQNKARRYTEMKFDK